MLQRLLAFFFHHLYHGLAGFYDLVAWIVSFGNWNEWIKSALPHIAGTRILELGHGPGHLQRILLDLGRVAAGLDESPQMARIAHRRIVQRGQYRGRLTRALAQSLPFRDAAFDTIIATFPTRYILDPRTLSEAQRVLVGAGRLIVLPAAWPRSKILNWLHRVTGGNLSSAESEILETWTRPFNQAGFTAEAKILEVKSGRLLIVIASKR